MKLSTKCKILKFDLQNTDKEEIQEKIEEYCENRLFYSKTVKAISTNIKNENDYIVNVIYETKLKWAEIFLFIIVYGSIIYMAIYLIVKLINTK
ncbi:MAG: hypothetical protein K2M08_07890 [Anaeroplasmataceae bacterium]|nr:hypothetical protein [Anaeroplasmataceae bacterium]